MKEFIVKDSAGFRLKVKTWKCLSPSDMNTLEFVQECKDKDGKVDFSSTYQFFMTDEEIKTLCNGLLKI